MQTLKEQPVIVTPNSLNYWRKKRGMTWHELARKMDCRVPALYRFYKKGGLQEGQEGGGIGPRKRLRLAEVLSIDLWQIYVPESDAEKKFGIIDLKGLTVST